MDRVQDAPVIDASVYRPIKKKPLPYRKLYNVQVLDHATGTIPQVLDTLKVAGPFQVKGWVPKQDTILSNGKFKGASSLMTEHGELVHIKAENIVEWNHEFNPSNVMRPVFWVLSENVCWYQIQTIHALYEPFFEPLANICSYLDAMIHSVLTLSIKDDLAFLVPKIVEILKLPEEKVKQELDRHRDRLIDLCSADSDLKKLRFYEQWVELRTQKLVGSITNGQADSGTIKLANSRTDDHVDVKGIDDIVMSDSERSLLSDRPLDPLPTIISYEMECQEQEIIPEALQEVYERLPAPCTEDLCPLHFSQIISTFNPISKDLEDLISERFNYNNSGWSEPDTFYCPIPGCLAAICNGVCSSPGEYVGEILHHVGQHDLSVNYGEAIIMDYLDQTKRQEATKNQRNTKGPKQNLNLQLYWILKSGGLQFKQKPPIKTNANANATVTRTRMMSRKRPELGGAAELPGALANKPTQSDTAKKQRVQKTHMNIRFRLLDMPPMDDNRQTTKKSPNPVNILSDGSHVNATSYNSTDASPEVTLGGNGMPSSSKQEPSDIPRKRPGELSMEGKESTDSGDDFQIRKLNMWKRFRGANIPSPTDSKRSNNEVGKNNDTTEHIMQDSVLRAHSIQPKDVIEQQYPERYRKQRPSDREGSWFRDMLVNGKKRLRGEYSDSSGGSYSGRSHSDPISIDSSESDEYYSVNEEVNSRDGSISGSSRSSRRRGRSIIRSRSRSQSRSESRSESRSRSRSRSRGRGRDPSISESSRSGSDTDSPSDHETMSEDEHESRIRFERPYKQYWRCPRCRRVASNEKHACRRNDIAYQK